MIIEGFTSKEWIAISDIISEYCPDDPLLSKLIKQIDDKTNLFKQSLLKKPHKVYIKVSR